MTTLATFDVLLRGDTRQFEQSMSRAQQTSNGFIKNMASVASGFVVANVAMRGFSLALDSAKEALFGYNARMEQARIGFTTLLQSGEKAEAFIYQLQQFANKTPFDFPGLQKASTTMMAMGFSAQEVIPTLTAVGDVVAAMGRSGGEASESINRIVYNLGQMKQYGRVTGRDIRDLTMLGVPVVKILAQGFHKSTTEMQQMITKGILPADKALKVLVQGIEKGNMGGMMAAQTKTFSGAMSTIKDVLSQLTGNALRPLFDVIRDVVVAFSMWIQGPKVMEWINQAQVTVRAFIIVLQNAIPVIQTFGKSLVAGIQTWVATFRNLLQGIAAQTQAFVKNMTTGGWNAVVAYVEGMYAAFKTYVVTFVQSMVSYISDYLIGASPPKKGALSKIDAGGKAVIDAWVKGALSANLEPITNIPKKIAGGLKALEAASAYINQHLDAIGDRLSLIDLNMAKINRAANQLRYAYEDAIAPLQKQYDLLTDTYSLADKQRDLQLALKKIDLQKQLNAAKGDWWAQAQIQAQIDLLDKQEEANRLLEEEERIKGQLAGIPLEQQMKDLTDQYKAATDPMERQLTLLQRQREELQYQSDVWRSMLTNIDKVVSSIQAAQSASAGGAGGGRKGAKKPALGGGVPVDAKNVIPAMPKGAITQKDMELQAQKLADAFIGSFNNRLTEHWPTLLGAAIGAVLGTLIPIPGIGTFLGATIGGAVGKFFETDIKNLAEQGMKTLQGIIAGDIKPDELLMNVRNAISNAVDWIMSTGIPMAGRAMGDFAIAFINWVGDTVPKILEQLPSITGAIINWIAENAPKIAVEALKFVGSLAGWILTELIPTLAKNFVQVAAAFARFIGTLAIQLVAGGIRLGIGFVDNMLKFIGELPGKVWGVLTAFVGKIASIVPTMVSTVRSAAGSLVKTFMDIVGKLPQQVGTMLGNIINTLTGWVKTGAEKFGNLAKSIGRAFANGLANLLEGAVNAIIRAINSFKLPKIQIDTPAGAVGFPGWGGFNIPLVNLPSFATGAWNLPRNIVAALHQGEMILPSDIATKFRNLIDTAHSGVAQSVTVNGPLVNIQEFHGTEGEVDKLMDDIALAIRLESR